MKKEVIIIFVIMIVISSAFALDCAGELQNTIFDGTCIDQTYTMLANSNNAYYSCDIAPEASVWYFEECTATVSSGTITSDEGSIVAEAWSNDDGFVSACSGYDEWICNVNPMFGFQTEYSLSYVGYCDSSEQTCVKCNGVFEELSYDGGLAIEGAGDDLCESGCGADLQCDEQTENYYNSNDNWGCKANCEYQECNLYSWNSSIWDCYSSCTNTATHCFSPGVCDLIDDNINECVIDSEAPIVTEILPLDDTRQNYNGLSYRFNVTDNADLTLDCGYVLNNVSVSVGEVTHNTEYENTIILAEQNWFELYFNCSDESGNWGVSNTLTILYDTESPEYSNYQYIDLTPTVDNTIIDGDLVNISAYWTDNVYLSHSELYSNRTGGWSLEDTFIHGDNNNAWSNFTFDTTGFGDISLSFIIKTYDSANNEEITPPIEFHTFTPRNDILVEINEEDGDNRLEFNGTAEAINNVKSGDSISNMLMGDFNITHEGIGTTILNSFRLADELVSGVQIKISGDNNPSHAVYLTTLYDNSTGICVDMIPGELCPVWMWMDLGDATMPHFNLTKIEVLSETI